MTATKFLCYCLHMKKIILLLILLAVLFVSSGQTYEQQSIVPDLEHWLPGKPLESVLSKLEIPYWGITVSVEERGYYYFVEFLLRKSAHFFMFGLIALAVYFVLPKHGFRTWTAAIITFLIAMADEYHQSLTGGRTPSFQDVMLDTAGAITALIVLRFPLLVTRRQTKKIR
ncbi:VanZ family protein [Sporosarcina sp. FSL K6-1522]|uniref:VanZ family protein n=1 Tax=Sporosarcina sp. FSL K6-1522 TaxID=2921554 RepID=UPI003159D9E8